MSSRQWGRVAQVVVGKRGAGLLVEHLRIDFEVVKSVEEHPNVAYIKVWNLSPEHEGQIKREFDDVVLQAGYDGQVRIVFRGNVVHVYHYRDGADRVTEIVAADGDADYRKSVVNVALAAGTSDDQLVDKLAGTMTRGTTRGHVAVSKRRRSRGKVVSGATRTVLRDLARENGAHWSIQDGQLQIVPADDVLPGEAIVITAETGMLGSPEVNDKGIAVKCLMNPQLRVNGTIRLDNNSLRYKRESPEALTTKPEKKGAPVRPSPDGLYKVVKLTHKGSTRGAEWASEIECVGLGDKLPEARKRRRATEPADGVRVP